MTPAFLSRAAERLHSKRFTFGLISLVGFVALFTVGHFAPQALTAIVSLAGPLVFLPWVIFCACTWFHPETGSLRATTGTRSAVLLREGLRWYAAIFVALRRLLPDAPSQWILEEGVA